MNNENNVIVLEYVKDAINNKKQYGTSVFDYVPDKDQETIENDFFKQDEFNKNEIESERSEMRKDYNGEKIVEKISTDALSGIKSSTPEEPLSKIIDELAEEVNKTDIRGKSITNYGRNLIKSLTGELPTEEDEKHISSKFEEHTQNMVSADDFFSMDVSILEDIVTPKIIDQLKALASDNTSDYKNILARFIQQIYIPYYESVEYKDEISNLNLLAKELDDAGLTKDDATSENVHMSLPDIQKKINEFMFGLKKLDERNSHLRQDYTINDIDTKLVEDVQECLNTALSFEKVKTKVDVTCKKFKKDIRRKDDVNKSIDSWIHSIKHDPYTLFTFPCNDYLSDEESREELVKYFFNAYMINIVEEKELEIPDDKDLEEYLIKSNYITTREIETMKHNAWVFLYALSRTFKYNKIEGNEENIRILSYTLDLISKLGIKSHRDRFIEASNYVNKILN